MGGCSSYRKIKIKKKKNEISISEQELEKPHTKMEPSTESTLKTCSKCQKEITKPTEIGFSCHHIYHKKCLKSSKKCLVCYQKIESLQKKFPSRSSSDSSWSSVKKADEPEAENVIVNEDDLSSKKNEKSEKECIEEGIENLIFQAAVEKDISVGKEIEGNQKKLVVSHGGSTVAVTINEPGKKCIM